MRYKKIIGRVFIFIGICTIISPIIIKSIVTKKINDDVIAVNILPSPFQLVLSNDCSRTNHFAEFSWPGFPVIISQWYEVYPTAPVFIFYI